MSPLFLLTSLFLFSPSSQFDEEGEGLRMVHSTMGRFKRQMSKTGAKWKDNTVRFEFEELGGEREKIMRAAMEYIGKRTCIRFEEDSKAKQKIVISTGGKETNDCGSIVGAPHSPGTEPLIFANCPQLGRAVHELSHSLGSFHEHARPDRDEHITIDMAKLKQLGLARQFEKTPTEMVATYVPFEYGSVMMYEADREGFTVITPKDAKYAMTMGNRRVGFYDILRINKHYECKCEKEELECANGGYTSPSDCSKCVCPSGYFGKHCHERPRKNSYELAADEQWKKKTVTFQYEFTGDNYAYFSSSYAFINAPMDKKVEVQLIEMNDVLCDYGCNLNGVEVKTREDIRSVSPIVCCQNQTFAEQVFLSHNNPTIIEFYSSVPKPAKVSFLYRAV